MEQFKRVQVILLPTENIVNALKGYNDNSLLFKYQKEYHTIEAEKKYVGFYHLYIISDDEIKEGDYFLADNRISQSSNSGKPNWIVCKCTEVKNTWKYCNEIPDEGHNGDWSKKIIATTDNLVITNMSDSNAVRDIDFDITIPKPSDSFITKYIEEYNKGNKIEDVLVEYDGIVKHCGGDFIPDKYVLKVNQDNTINIKLPKDSWNREEVIELIKNFNKDTLKGYSIWRHDEWIEENL